MDFDKVMEALGLTGAGEIWRSEWERSESSFVKDKVFFLEPGYVIESCDGLKMKDETKQLFLKGLSVFKDNIPLQRLVWHCHFMIYRIQESQSENCRNWPAIPKQADGTPDLFYPLIVLSGVLQLLNFHQERSIPLSVSLDTLSGFEPAMSGPNAGERVRETLWWCNYIFTGKIYKLGRLQYHLNTIDHDFHVFRNKKNRKVVMLCGNNMKFRADGQFDGVNGIYDKENAWTAIFKVEKDFICGNPVSVSGSALKEVVKLPVSEWQEVLKKDDLTLGIHIPATGPMDHSECGESFRQAIEFFPRHFPDFPYKAFKCESWLLDYQLEKYLPESSNIVKFLREFYLFPSPFAGDKSIFNFVFHKKFNNLDEIPQETSLQRAIVKHMKSGGRWRTACCFLFPEDFKWGEKVYRKELNFFN